MGFAALAALTACGGTTTGSVQPVKVVAGRAQSLNFSQPSASTSVDNVVVTYVSATTLDVATKNQVSRLNYDPMLGYYVSSDGSTLLAITSSIGGMAPSQNVEYYFMVKNDPVFTPFILNFAAGNTTLVANIPTASATYLGKAEMIDAFQNTAIGDVTLIADLSGGFVLGSTTGILPADTTLSFQFNGSANSDGSVNGNMLAGSPNVTVSNSFFYGNFFGPSGDEIAGTISLNTSSGSAIGVFGTVKQ